MTDRQRNAAAVLLVLVAIAGAVLLWPAGPVPLDDAWLTDPVCEPAEGGVQFAANVHAPNTTDDQLLLADLERLVVTVEAHEGGRRVASTETSYAIEAPAQAQASLLVGSTAAPAPLAVIDVVLPAGRIKSPTCHATVIGHR